MKHKIAFLIIGPFLIVSGCSRLFYEKVQEFDDEFNNSKKIIARMHIKPQERRTEINYARIIFEREFSDQSEALTTYFVVSRSSSSFKTGQAGYLRIGNDNFRITPGSILSEQKSETESSVSAYIDNDGTSVSPGSTTDTDTRLWIEDKFRLTMTPEMITKIKTADVITFRFDFGPIPGTFKIKGLNLDRIKKILKD